MKQQILVADSIHTSVTQYSHDVLTQFLADTERVVQFSHQLFLFGSQCCQTCGEVTISHRIFAIVNRTHLTFQVNVFQQATLLHTPLRSAMQYACLLLELYDADSLMHLCCQLQCLLVYLCIFQQYWLERLAWVVAVGIKCKCGQRHKVYTISILQRCEVGVAQTQAQHVADAGVVACGSTHPQHVVIAPLDVPRLVAAHHVHDDVRPRSAVVNVAQDVQLVYGQPLYDVTQGADEVVGAPRRDDGVHDDRHVGRLVLVVGTLVQQLLDDVRELLRQRLAHLRARVLRRHVAAHLHQLVNRQVVPVVHVLLCRLDELQFLFGVVDQRAQLLLLRLAYRVAENLAHLAFDVARRVLQHVLEGLVLAVNVGQEVLRTLWQVHDSLQVDNLLRCVGNRRKRLRQKSQVVHIGCVHAVIVCFFRFQLQR